MRLIAVDRLLNIVRSSYFILFEQVAATRLQKKDLDVRVIHAHLITVLTTGALMWSYTVVAYFTIDHPLPTVIGITASLIHMLSPKLFVFSNNGMFVCSVMLGAGLAHQLTFAWFSGGFSSPLLIWFGILPMLAGIIVGRWGVAFWSLVTTSVASFFLYLDLQNYVFPQLISNVGLLISQALLVFGWIFLSTVIIFIHLFLQTQHEHKLTESKQYINDLLQILTHDLNTPISVIGMALPTLQENKIKKQQQAINIIAQAHQSMADITGDVRRLYALEHNEYQPQNQLYSLNQSVSDVLGLLQSKMALKKVSVRYDFEANQSHMLWVDPCIFNYQIMTNILSNAVKFSLPNSYIDIKGEEHGNRLHIYIQDFGIGMPPEIIEQLFTPELKTSRPGTEGEEGTGYGMLIMKRALNKLQGNVAIKSKEQNNELNVRGTLFTLDMPITK